MNEHHGKNNQKVMYREFRKRLRFLLLRIPPSEYPRMIAEAEELTRQIKADSTLYEPVHCVHPDPQHGVIKRHQNGTAAAAAKSRLIVKALAEKIPPK